MNKSDNISDVTVYPMCFDHKSEDISDVTVYQVTVLAALTV